MTDIRPDPGPADLALPLDLRLPPGLPCPRLYPLRVDDEVALLIDAEPESGPGLRWASHVWLTLAEARALAEALVDFVAGPDEAARSDLSAGSGRSPSRP